MRRARPSELLGEAADPGDPNVKALLKKARFKLGSPDRIPRGSRGAEAYIVNTTDPDDDELFDRLNRDLYRFGLVLGPGWGVRGETWFGLFKAGVASSMESPEGNQLKEGPSNFELMELANKLNDMVDRIGARNLGQFEKDILLTLAKNLMRKLK